MKDHHFSLAAGIIFAVLGAFAHFAHAADLGMKDNPHTAVATGCDCGDAINWAGLSIGIEAGVLNVNHGVDLDETEGEKSFNFFHLDGFGGNGFVGRVSLGYDIQLGQDWVAGLRGWYGISSVDSNVSLFDGELSAKLKRGNDYGGVVRLGRILGSERRTGIFVEGGYQWAKYDLSASDGGLPVDLSSVLDTSKTYQGFVAGAAIEHAFTRNIFASLNYQHWFANDEEWLKVEGASLKIGAPEDTITARIRYKF